MSLFDALHDEGNTVILVTYEVNIAYLPEIHQEDLIRDSLSSSANARMVARRPSPALICPKCLLAFDERMLRR